MSLAAQVLIGWCLLPSVQQQQANTARFTLNKLSTAMRGQNHKCGANPAPEQGFITLGKMRCKHRFQITGVKCVFTRG